MTDANLARVLPALPSRPIVDDTTGSVGAAKRRQRHRILVAAREPLERFPLSTMMAFISVNTFFPTSLHDTDEALDGTINELLNDIASGADDRNGFSESEARMQGADRYG